MVYNLTVKIPKVGAGSFFLRADSSQTHSAHLNQVLLGQRLHDRSHRFDANAALTITDELLASYAAGLEGPADEQMKVIDGRFSGWSASHHIRQRDDRPGGWAATNAMIAPARRLPIGTRHASGAVRSAVPRCCRQVCRLARCLVARA